MTNVSEILSDRFLIDIVWVDRLSLFLQTPDGHRRPLERSLSLRVMAIEKNNTPGFPLREATYDLVFKEVSGFRIDMPIKIEETSFIMDVDDVSLKQSMSGVMTLQFQNGNTLIAIAFKEVSRTLVSIKECEH